MSTTRSAARLAELARQITGLAAQRDWTAGHHVTEAEVCQALAVSRTPVRKALRLLETAKVVEARSGRGFYLLEDGAAAVLRSVLPEPTEEEALYASILRDRVADVLSGNVTRSLLLARYGSGRATMETVLARLADDGLLLRGAGRRLSFAASVGDASSVRASYELRLVVEPAALLLPGFHPVPDVLGVLRDRHHAMRDDVRGGRAVAPGRLVGLDADFHITLGGFCGNPFMAAVIRQQTELRRLMEHAANEDAARVRLWLDEHCAVLDAVAAGDHPRAAAALRHHLDRAFRFSSKSGPRPPPAGPQHGPPAARRPP